MLLKPGTPADRLIVAADFKPTYPDGRERVRDQVLTLADSIAGTRVYLKVNSALRACGYSLIDEIHSRGLRVFADLKLHDIGNTLSTDGVLLAEAKPELLTVVCSTGVEAMKALKAKLPDTEVLGVTVLTSQMSNDTLEIYGKSIESTVRQLVRLGIDAGIDGFICSPHEVAIIRELAGDSVTINTPGIRLSGEIIAGDDQNPERIMTPAKAIEAGADRIVMGRSIVLAKDPYDAVMRIIEEIALVRR